MDNIEITSDDKILVKDGWEQNPDMLMELINKGKKAVFPFMEYLPILKAKQILDNNIMGRVENIRVFGMAAKDKQKAMVIENIEIAKFLMGEINESFEWNIIGNEMTIPPFPMTFKGIQKMGFVETYPSKYYDYAIEIEVSATRGNIWIKGYKEFISESPTLSIYLDNRFIIPALETCI